jgi:hypothetical protein
MMPSWDNIAKLAALAMIGILVGAFVMAILTTGTPS